MRRPRSSPPRPGCGVGWAASVCGSPAPVGLRLGCCLQRFPHLVSEGRGPVFRLSASGVPHSCPAPSTLCLLREASRRVSLPLHRPRLMRQAPSRLAPHGAGARVADRAAHVTQRQEDSTEPPTPAPRAAAAGSAAWTRVRAPRGETRAEAAPVQRPRCSHRAHPAGRGWGQHGVAWTQRLGPRTLRVRPQTAGGQGRLPGGQPGGSVRTHLGPF